MAVSNFNSKDLVTLTLGFLVFSIFACQAAAQNIETKRTANEANFHSLGGGVIQLNRFNFYGNVAPNANGHRDTVWFVSFCYDWVDECMKHRPAFRRLAVEWEQKLNSGEWMRPKVRFAEVECSTDRQLCTDEDVHDYPMVARYGGQRLLGSATTKQRSWITGLDGELLRKWPQRLAAFVQANLEGQSEVQMLHGSMVATETRENAPGVPATLEQICPESAASGSASCCPGPRCSERPVVSIAVVPLTLAAFVLLSVVFRIIDHTDLMLTAVILVTAAGTATGTSKLLA